MKNKTLLRMLGVLALTMTAGLPAQTSDAPDRATALADARAGNWEQAEPALVALANGTPTDVEACVLLAQHCLAQSRNKEAVDLAEKATTAVPDDAGLQSLLGMALSRRIGELTFSQQGFIAARMLRAFSRAVELDPRQVPALVGLANYYLQAPEIAGGSLEKAEEYAVRVEALDPDGAAALREKIRARKGQ